MLLFWKPSRVGAASGLSHAACGLQAHQVATTMLGQPAGEPGCHRAWGN